MPQFPAYRFLLALPALLVAWFAVAQDGQHVPTHLNEATIAQLQADMDSGRLTSVELTNYYIKRIELLDQSGPGVNAVIEFNPDALVMAQHADQLRHQGFHNPLLGIPVLLKDNIGTGDRMQTSAGSFALVGHPAVQDSTIAHNLRAAGAVILGKTNLSEWANFRSFESISGWSGRGGQTNNPYGIDRNPCGSSSGSAAAASANFTAVSLGTETDGSVVCPGNASGVVGLKPTIGLTSRAGVVPISHTQDTVGIHARTVADAAATLGIIQSRTFDGSDPATGGVPLGWQACNPACSPNAPLPGHNRPALPTDYTQFLDPQNGLKGARVGITRAGLSGFPGNSTPQSVLNAFDEAVQALQDAGATIIELDDGNPNNFAFSPADGEFMVLLYDFKFDVASYFATRVGVPVAGGTLQTAIDFNNAHVDSEMPFFNQDIFDFANTMNADRNFCDSRFTSAVLPSTASCMTYNDALKIGHLAGAGGIDAAISQFNLDAVVSATDNPAWATDLLYGDHFLFGTSSLAASPGYPIIQVPAAFPKQCSDPAKPADCTQFGVPLGISFFGTAFSEPKLIKLASAFEAATQTRAHNLPTFAATAPYTHIQGTTPTPPHTHGQSKDSAKNKLPHHHM
ncbi:MAG: amidase [Acidobacteria bacterium]|nr:amidase [Acidobacteriota bacterium]